MTTSSAAFAATIYAMAAFGTMHGTWNLVENTCYPVSAGAILIAGIIWPVTITSEIMAPTKNLCKG